MKNVPVCPGIVFVILMFMGSCRLIGNDLVPVSFDQEHPRYFQILRYIQQREDRPEDVGRFVVIAGNTLSFCHKQKRIVIEQRISQVRVGQETAQIVLEGHPSIGGGGRGILWQTRSGERLWIMFGAESAAVDSLEKVASDVRNNGLDFLTAPADTYIELRRTQKPPPDFGKWERITRKSSRGAVAEALREEDESDFRIEFEGL